MRKPLGQVVRENIFAWRDRRGITNAELARRAKIDKSGLTKMQTLERDPDLETVQHLADALGLDPADLLRSETKASTEDEREIADLVYLFKRLGQTQKTMAIAYLQGLAGQTKL